jgi:hypothetical protein
MTRRPRPRLTGPVGRHRPSPLVVSSREQGSRRLLAGPEAVDVVAVVGELQRRGRADEQGGKDAPPHRECRCGMWSRH